MLQQIPLLTEQALYTCEARLPWDNRARWDTAVPNGRKTLLPMGSAFLKPAHGSFCLAWGSGVSFDLKGSAAVYPSLAPLFPRIQWLARGWSCCCPVAPGLLPALVERVTLEARDEPGVRIPRWIQTVRC